jgi:hypothetical protein
MRTLLFLAVCTAIFPLVSLQAQLSLSAQSAFRTGMQKVVAAYPEQFAPLRGEVLLQNPQTVEYASLLMPAGTTAPTITQYSAAAKAVYSWQALLVKSEDFEEAVKKYKWAYQQLKGLKAGYAGAQYPLQGIYEAPAETKKFASSTLRVADLSSPLKKLALQVSVQFEFPEWAVRVMVFEKEKEDNEEAGQMEQ